jgi:hypothetical protein
MAKFEVGDWVVMPKVPLPPVQILAIRRCEDENCPYPGQEVFDFQDPHGPGVDSMHTSEFEKAPKPQP